mmetsp:Transcript_11643/g.16159  ORF Transcript_11643/g.16159 Transcript_11643/m.16159 type:complete len:126 (-) Transcript_11643:1668-2045(-)
MATSILALKEKFTFLQFAEDNEIVAFMQQLGTIPQNSNQIEQPSLQEDTIPEAEELQQMESEEIVFQNQPHSRYNWSSRGGMREIKNHGKPIEREFFYCARHGGESGCQALLREIIIILQKIQQT